MMKPTSTLRCVLAFTWLFGFNVLGQEPQTAAKPANSAQTAAKPEFFTSMTLEKVQGIIAAMGFEVTRDKDNDGKPVSYFVFKAEGYKVGASVPEPDFIWLYNEFTDKATLETINEWNESNRFSRVYLGSKDKGLYLETEIVVAGGITRENIELQIKQFRDSVARWARFVIDHQQPATPAAQKQ